MPIYVFKCKHCGLLDELILKPSQINSTQVCSCGGDMKRLVTCANFKMDSFKSGVYTDQGKFVEGRFEK